MLPGCLQWQLQKQVMAASLARGAPSARDYRYIGDSGKRQTSGGSTHWNMAAQLPPASSTSPSIPLAPRVLCTMQRVTAVMVTLNFTPSLSLLCTSKELRKKPKQELSQSTQTLS